MTNTRNFGIATGRLTKDPHVFPVNKDGSRKLKVSLAVQDNFKNKEGQRGVQFLEFEAFVPGSKEGLGVYDYMHKGDLVSLGYTLRTNNYKDANGVMHYGQIALIQEVDLMASKKTEAKDSKAENQATAAPAQDDPEDLTAWEDDKPF